LSLHSPGMKRAFFRKELILDLYIQSMMLLLCVARKMERGCLYKNWHNFPDQCLVSTRWIYVLIWLICLSIQANRAAWLVLLQFVIGACWLVCWKL
jgi:hypothetical protein